jgi:hypothetical protein
MRVKKESPLPCTYGRTLPGEDRLDEQNLLINRMANRENFPQFCIVATVYCFCYDEPYYYMM